MFTGRTRIRAPGILATSESETPSLGCTLRISWLGCTPERAGLLEGQVRAPA